MDELNEYDLKQIRLIGKKIELFEKNKLVLFALIADLGGLLNAIEFVPGSWKDDFQAEINMLEMIHDSMEDGSISKWRGNFKEDMQKAILKIKQLSASIQEEYLKIPDQNICESAIEADPNWLICPKCFEAWESSSSDAMVICPKCDRAFHNPVVLIMKEPRKDAK